MKKEGGCEWYQSIGLKFVSNLCNLFLPALRETQPQLELWHVLILLVPILLVLLALGATAFWATGNVP
jgi:hypothetical protein